jgi:hypothetical protein
LNRKTETSAIILAATGNNPRNLIMVCSGLDKRISLQRHTEGLQMSTNIFSKLAPIAKELVAQ